MEIGVCDMAVDLSRISLFCNGCGDSHSAIQCFHFRCDAGIELLSGIVPLQGDAVGDIPEIESGNVQIDVRRGLRGIQIEPASIAPEVGGEHAELVAG